MTLPIVTQRLLLRRFRHEDVPHVLAFLSHPSVTSATPEIEPTESGVTAYIARQTELRPFELDKCFDLAIQVKADGRVIGLVTFVRRQGRQGEIGYALGIDHRGQGYATEAAAALINYAFAWLDTHRIYATISSDNPSSRKVMERLGIRREARLRESVFREGVWLDTLIYAVLDHEWRSDGTVTRPLVKKIDCLQLHLPDLDAGLAFYGDQLGHEIIWRTETAAGLRLPESDAELVLQTEREEMEVNLLVPSVEEAVARFVVAGGSLLVAPFDIPVGRCAVVADPWGNRLILLDLSRGTYVTDDAGNVIGVRSP